MEEMDEILFAHPEWIQRFSTGSAKDPLIPFSKDELLSIARDSAGEERMEMYKAWLEGTATSSATFKIDPIAVRSSFLSVTPPYNPFFRAFALPSIRMFTSLPSPMS